VNYTSILVGIVAVKLLDDDDAIVRMTNNGKVWEPETRQVWSALVQRGGMVIDIGAYTGIYAIASSLIGAKVVALEPHPANYLRLLENAKLNGVGSNSRSVRFDALKWAASNCGGHRALKMTKPETSLSDTAAFNGGPYQCDVPCIPVDDLVLSFAPTLIKIDAEGHELEIIKGATHTLKRYRPVVLVECLSQAAVLAIADQMEVLGYASDGVLDRRNWLYRARS